jgi:hypothetical protein
MNAESTARRRAEAAIGLLAGVIAAPLMLVRRLRGRPGSRPVAEEEVLVEVELAPLHR